MRWPQAYSSGPQKLSHDDVRKLQDVTPEQARGVMKSVLGEADFAELERRVLAMLPPAHVLMELERIGVVPKTPVREAPPVRYDAPGWKPSFPGEDPPF
ncbi:hypothetical protein Pan1_04 [Pseudanabaena phage Pan1]|nr:hypothetical protein Pan1_04 [Pseudanabaena phage Pan1]